MLRSCIQLDKIAFLLRYINGKVDDRSDDIICPSRLYDYICRILDRIMLDGKECSVDNLKECISEEIKDYEEKISGAARRLQNALEIIIVAYYSSVLKNHTDKKLAEIMN
jgi:hypothetical protein